MLTNCLHFYFGSTWAQECLPARGGDTTLTRALGLPQWPLGLRVLQCVQGIPSRQPLTLYALSIPRREGAGFPAFSHFLSIWTPICPKEPHN